MSEIVETVLYVFMAVIIFTAIYHIVPFKKWTDGKSPRFVFFPKYNYHFHESIDLLENRIAGLGFKRKSDVSDLWYRGKLYGDFSSKKIRLQIFIDREDSKVKLYASHLGILFDFGDLWLLMKEIVSGE